MRRVRVRNRFGVESWVDALWLRNVDLKGLGLEVVEEVGEENDTAPQDAPPQPQPSPQPEGSTGRRRRA